MPHHLPCGLRQFKLSGQDNVSARFGLHLADR
jgi:hypothetical protein